MTSTRSPGRKRPPGRPTSNENESHPRKLLVLHGNRQTGQLLLGRMDKLRKKLVKRFGNFVLVAPDAPFVHPEDAAMRTWWNRRPDDPNHYDGLEESLRTLERLWNAPQQQGSFEGILGFSQGARLAHLLCFLAHSNRGCCQDDSANIITARRPLFPNLRYVILVSGYDAPLPTKTYHSIFQKLQQNLPIDSPSLHVWGERDALISPEKSRQVMNDYVNPSMHIHEGGHHVPMRAVSVGAYLDFIETVMRGITNGAVELSVSAETTTTVSAGPMVPDEEAKQAQCDEVEALRAIFPDEVTVLSEMSIVDEGMAAYDYPISYDIALAPSDVGTWPPHPLTLRITYPPNYPSEVGPEMSFRHVNNVMEFSSKQKRACMSAVHEVAVSELGMPCVLSCVYAVRDFFESGGMDGVGVVSEAIDDIEENADDSRERVGLSVSIQAASPERIEECSKQGMEIARSVLDALTTPTMGTTNGGVWKYTIGLVGKPSAGKSTFFNAATGFARQRDDGDKALGGATMAPHPFTTIDPNVGFCLVPAPEGSCPEEALNDPHVVACTHGRDSMGRRLVPVMLKDVAGLVPGAYQGRGRGNKFLNDLTDADVLIHVVDASGTADPEGNAVGDSDGGGSCPRNDLAWIQSELKEWVHTNLLHKWDSICKRGRGKLSDMFSGYGQNQATTGSIFAAVDKFMGQSELRDHALDHIEDWDQGDVHRLVSAFLGVRFPMALSLNKYDLPSAAQHVEDIQEALPIHGAHVGVPLCARSEMEFVRYHMTHDIEKRTNEPNTTVPRGVWDCLQSAITIREPVLVFPVSDMNTYAPLSAMFRVATQNASLPSAGMARCLQASGGCAPTLWREHGGYATSPSSIETPRYQPLRDVLLLKPGSTVDDVFVELKKMGALGGEFVRAEGACAMGDKAKPVPKHELIGVHNRILKIMTNKRREWQNHKAI